MEVNKIVNLCMWNQHNKPSFLFLINTQIQWWYFFYPPVDQLSGYINAHAHVNSITIIRLFIRRESLQYLSKQEEELIPGITFRQQETMRLVTCTHYKVALTWNKTSALVCYQILLGLVCYDSYYNNNKTCSFPSYWNSNDCAIDILFSFRCN